MNKLKIIIALMSAALLSACATEKQVHRTEQEVTAAAALNKEAAKVADADYFTEVEFAPGSTTLTPSSQRSINNLLNRAKGRGELKEVVVLAWADQELPSKEKKNLTGPQRKLADNRNKSVEKYIDSLSTGVDVDTYNMAERPAALGRMLNTRDARFKETLTAAGLPTTASDPQYPSKASRAVILVNIK